MTSQHLNPTTPGPDKTALRIVYFTVFLDLLGFGIILPWLPYYAAHLGATGVGLGVLFTSYSSAQLVGAAILGRLSDRHGRRPVLLVSLAGAAVGMVLSGLAETLWFLCMARAMAGLFGGSIATAQAYVADVTTRQERPKYMGMVGAAIGLGFVVGPALGAGFIALGYGFRTVAFFSAALLFSNLCFAYFRLRESRVADSKPGSASHRFSLKAWNVVFRQRALRGVLAATFLTTFAFVGMETTLAFLARDRFGFGELQFGLLLTYAGVVMIIVQGGLIGPLSKRFGVRRLAVAGGLLLGLALAALPLAPNLAIALVAIGLLAAGQGLSTPSLSSLNSQLARPEEQGTVLGVAQSLSSAARAVGPLLAGALYDMQSGLPYFVSGAFAVLGAGLVATGVQSEEALTPASSAHHEAGEDDGTAKTMPDKTGSNKTGPDTT
jgi:DHA1 family tetracycline resistance protein-like MFS transporter